MSDLKQYYIGQIESFTREINKIKQQLLLISIARLLAFLLFVISPFWIYSANNILGVISSLIFLIIFLLLVKSNTKISSRNKYLENRVTICRNEIKALDHNFEIFDPGNEFINPHHVNSYDLDVFGTGSLFQFLNRTVTFKGKIYLADMLCFPLTQNSELYARQELISELSNDIAWRHDFNASGMMYSEDKEESLMFEKWGKEKFNLRLEKFMPELLYILPIVSVLSIIYWIVYSNSAFFIISCIIQVSLWVLERENIKIIYSRFGKREKILTKYATLFSKIEKRAWKSREAQIIIKEINQKGIPSEEINRLKRIILAFDNRNNFLIGVLLNVVFLWDIRCSFQLVKWHNRNVSNYGTWESTTSFFDAVNSLANLAYNRREYTFPSFKEGIFFFDAKDLGHPLIHPDKMATNNFHIGYEMQTVIITGANMAGKSTFLRTVGINMVLGMCGAPVCSSKMEFVPVEVFSNMRTTDSLFDEESYFFAELKRIKAILDTISTGKPVLIILDEILKGTNSVDKLSGSQKLVKKLIALNVPAIIATHDLKLTELKAEFPNNIQNNCFEITIEDDEMSFDYILREGVTQTMNATFLMRKMGII